MACYYPVNAWKSQRLNESGKRGIVFNIREGFADMPLQVPCGKCAGCMASRSQEWAVRAYHEASQHDRNCFVTLTYADPPPPSIDKKHLQDFFKRARHKYDFRYLACGEYGEQTHRPHYHALIFGEDFLDEKIAISDSLYTSQPLADLWSHGHVAVAELSMATCCYVAGYVNKKIGDEDTFALRSTRPGLGKGWLEKYSDEIRRNGFVVIEGKKIPIPKRYLAWKEEELIEVKKDRARMFKDMTPDERWERAEALPNREINKKADLATRSKKL